MKKITVVSLCLVLLLVSAISVSAFAKDEKDQKSTKADENVVYTCPMHPEVISDKPGSCPKCGMFLVKKEKDHGLHVSMKMDEMQGMK